MTLRRLTGVSRMASNAIQNEIEQDLLELNWIARDRRQIRL
jgi:hypothetical protein